MKWRCRLGWHKPGEVELDENVLPLQRWKKHCVRCRALVYYAEG